MKEKNFRAPILLAGARPFGKKEALSKSQAKSSSRKDLQKQLITNPLELKNLYLNTFKYRLWQRPVKPGIKQILTIQEELIHSRLEFEKKCKTPNWKIKDLVAALNKFKKSVEIKMGLFLIY